MISYLFDSRIQCFERLAVDLAQALTAPEVDLCLLAGGQTPQPLWPFLTRQPVDWARVRFTPSDERWVPAQAAQSNWQALRIGLPQAELLDPRHNQSDPLQAAHCWGRTLNQARATAAVLGMGEDGHFASLFAGDPASRAGLNPAAPPAVLVTQAPSAPHLRLSPNLAYFAGSQWLALLILGESKLKVLQERKAQLPIHQLLQACPQLRLYWAP